MKNQGISLITLIITIIVIIILAAIVIFTGLGTPDSANFAHFCQDVDNVQSVVLNSFADLKANYATQNQTRTDEQLYMEIATGNENIGQYSHMSTTGEGDSEKITSAPAGFKVKALDDACQNILSGAKLNGFKLPQVRQSDKAWYVTANGQVFNATGYVYKVDGTDYTYFTANTRINKKLNATNADYGTARAKTIAKSLNTGNAITDAEISAMN